MKKLFYLLTLSIVTYCFTGCTLMMEDFEVPEAERGIGKPYTEIIPDVGYVTFEYQEGVKPFTSDMLNFVAQVEADSILYIYDYIPEDMLPAVGQKVAAGCTPTIPHGLNNKVLSVENVGGLYKVVTTVVGEDDIYKELDYEINFDYVADVANLPVMPDSATMVELGLQPTDLAITDWSVYEKFTRKKKRAENKDDFDEDEFEDTDERKEVPIILVIDTRQLQDGFRPEGLEGLAGRLKTQLVDKMKDYLKRFPGDLSPYFVIGYQNETTHTIYTKKSKKEKLEINWTDTEDVSKFMIEGGVTGGAPFFQKKSDWESFLDELDAAAMTDISDRYLRSIKLKDFKPKFEKWSETVRKIKESKWEKIGDRGVGVYIPFPCSPSLEFYIQLSYDFKWDMAISGGYAYIVTTKRRTGSEIRDGVETPIKSDDKKNRSTSHSLYLQGNFKVEGEAGAEIGIRALKTFGAGGYFYAKAGIEGNAQVDFMGGSAGRVFANENSFVRAYVEAGANLRFNVAPLGLKVWEYDWPIKQWTLAETKLQAYPSFKTSPVPGSLTLDDATPKLKFEYELNTTSTVIPGSSFFLCPDYKPYLLIYANSMDERNLVAKVNPKNNDKEKFKFEYEFKNGEYNENNTYMAVPAIESFYDTMYDDLAYVLDEPKPKLTMLALQQTLGEEILGNFQMEEHGLPPEEYVPGLTVYKFVTMLDISQRKLMKEWGVVVQIYHPSLGLLTEKEIPINRTKSGNYSITTTFMTNYNGENGFMIATVCPYFIDIEGNRIEGEREDIDLAVPVNQPFADSGTKVEVEL